MLFNALPVGHNIFVFAAIDIDCLCKDVRAILEDYDNTFYLSAESVKEQAIGTFERYQKQYKST